MKLFCVTGGFIGFVLTFLAGLVGGGPIGMVLRDASIGCLAGAFLMRWWFAVLGRNLREAVAERQSQMDAASAVAEKEAG